MRLWMLFTHLTLLVQISSRQKLQRKKIIRCLYDLVLFFCLHLRSVRTNLILFAVLIFSQNNLHFLQIYTFQDNTTRHCVIKTFPRTSQDKLTFSRILLSWCKRSSCFWTSLLAASFVLNAGTYFLFFTCSYLKIAALFKTAILAAFTFFYNLAHFFLTICSFVGQPPIFVDSVAFCQSDQNVCFLALPRHAASATTSAAKRQFFLYHSHKKRRKNPLRGF